MSVNEGVSGTNYPQSDQVYIFAGLRKGSDEINRWATKLTLAEVFPSVSLW